MTLHVELVAPEGEVWVGDAVRIIAKTLDGDVGILTGHTPLLGILAEGSVVRIQPEDGQDDGEVTAAIGGGFLSVADDRVSILARQALLGRHVDRAQVQSALDAAGTDDEDDSSVRYLQAQLRAAGDRA